MSDIRAADSRKIAIRLPATLLTKIDAAARAQGVGRSAFVRRALESQTKSASGVPREDSLYDVLMRDGVIGRFSGPPGLARTSRSALVELIAQSHGQLGGGAPTDLGKGHRGNRSRRSQPQTTGGSGRSA